MDFRKALAQGSVLLLDGAMGTMLQAQGMPAGIAPERFCYDNPSLVAAIHTQYIEAGASIITTCTFGANPYKLDPSLDVAAYSTKMACVAKEAAAKADHPVFVAGNLGPSGQFITPLGTVEPEALIDAYKEQVRALLRGHVDVFLIETQFDLAEARALVIAVRSLTDLPVLVSMTFEDGVSLTGSTPEIFCATMENLGVDVIGTNCSAGPDQMRSVLARMRTATHLPLLVEPNAGIPSLVNGETVFPLDAETFAAKTASFVDMGVSIVGGCCGTTPAFIRALHNALPQRRVSSMSFARANVVRLTSRSKLVSIGAGQRFCLIGERINPTGKKQLTKELQEGSLTCALAYGLEECEQGADVLDVNVGAPLVDESRLLPRLIASLVGRVDVPLSLDSSNSSALAKALPYCPGSALLNSISGEGDRLEQVAPLCVRYGAPCILLPLEGKHLPVLAKERIAIVESLLLRLEAQGVPPSMVLVDILALTVSANQESAMECLKVLAWCQAHGLATTLGLSNISFGLPARELLNGTFLCMAAGAGLSSAIANPMAGRIREALAAIALLQNHDPNASSFISAYATWKPNAPEAVQERHSSVSQSLTDAVILGDSDHVVDFVEEELAKGKDPFALVQDILIPAITEVGAKYERKEYFLPQLLRSAETMQKAFAHVRPLLEKRKESAEQPVIVLATVEGDIHDIGKNIVALMLSNYGFTVIDLGKDVCAKTIVDCAERSHAKIIGLSALMTTTMVKMQETIALLAERKLPIKVMIGGACVTQSYADAIGADAYCADAVAAVRAAKALLG